MGVRGLAARGFRGIGAVRIGVRGVEGRLEPIARRILNISIPFVSYPNKSDNLNGLSTLFWHLSKVLRTALQTASYTLAR